jgi:hypothetical protein
MRVRAGSSRPAFVFWGYRDEYRYDVLASSSFTGVDRPPTGTTRVGYSAHVAKTVTNLPSTSGCFARLTEWRRKLRGGCDA